MNPFAFLPDAFVGVFGETVTLTPPVGAPVAVSAIRLDEPLMVDTEYGMQQARRERFDIRATDAPTVAAGWGLTVGGTTFEVVVVEPDGKGMVALRVARI